MCRNRTNFARDLPKGKVVERYFAGLMGFCEFAANSVMGWLDRRYIDIMGALGISAGEITANFAGVALAGADRTWAMDSGSGVLGVGDASMISGDNKAGLSADAARTEKAATPPSRALRREALKNLEDGELLGLFQAGDEEAFYTLFERRHKEIFTHCFRMCGGDAEKANDAFQDTFVKVFTRKELFTDAAHGRAWLYRIATNTCLNALRYDKRHPKEQLDNVMEQSVTSLDPRFQPDFSTEQANLRTELERAIAKLPLDLREPFLLRELEEFSYEEVAEQLGLTVAACRQRVYRAKQQLREELQEIMTGEAKSRSRRGRS